MSILTRQPVNKNFLSPLGFKFLLLKAPTVEYFVQSVNLPSLGFQSADVPTPFVSLPFPGDHLRYGEFNLTFKIDEDMKNYLEIFNWLVGLGFPDTFDQYKNIANVSTRDGVVSDATLMILTSAKNPNISISFKNMFPTSLSDIQFDTTQTDVEFVNATATFKYQSFTIAQI